MKIAEHVLNGGGVVKMKMCPSPTIDLRLALLVYFWRHS